MKATTIGGSAALKEASMTVPQASTITSPSGVRIGFERWGEGPPLVLVHGAFSDHRTNWMYVKPHLERHFTIHAMARRGRGATEATAGHGIEDEAEDVVALIRQIGAPVCLLGHSYGGHVALTAASRVPELVRKLILYEPPWPHLIEPTSLAALDPLAEAGDWDGFARTFFAEILSVPQSDLEALRGTADWSAILTDAPATLCDLRALSRYQFVPERFRELSIPVLLQVGSESPPNLYATDALAATLPDATIDTLAGQAHEGMTTAPELYAESVRRYLLS